MKTSKTLLNAVLASVLALGASGQAAAGTYAGSALDINNLTITISPFVNASINNFSFTITNTASLTPGGLDSHTANCGGLPGPGNNDCSTTSPVLNAAVANAPGSNPLRGENVFTVFGPIATNYSSSDGVITTAELVNIGNPSSTSQIAESNITSVLAGAANSEITSVTGFTFSFTLANPGSMTIDLDADSYLRAAILSDPFGLNAGANIQVDFKLVQNSDLGGNGLKGSWLWSPDGSTATGCTVSNGVTCTEINDDYVLNNSAGVSTPGLDDTQRAEAAGFGNFTATAGNLDAGDWTLTLFAKTSTTVRRKIPEPGTLLLIGSTLGLVGLFGGRNRRRVLIGA